MSIPYAILWLVVAVICAVIEMATPSSLVSIWFACGAAVAVIFSFIVDIFWVLFLIFIAASGICLLLMRPIARKKLQGEKKPTNADRLIGCTAIVTDKIDNEAGHGMVKVNNQIWTARSDNESITISPEERVIVKRIEGAKLIVAKEGEKDEDLSDTERRDSERRERHDRQPVGRRADGFR